MFQTKRKTFASIMATFTNTIKELEQHAEEHTQHAARFRQDAIVSHLAADAAALEASQARTAAAKITSLVQG